MGQYGLAIMHDLGEGLPQNSKTAVEYYRAAAEQGFADAQNNLGVMYDQGEGIDNDYKKAMKWYDTKTLQLGGQNYQNFPKCVLALPLLENLYLDLFKC